MILNSTAVEMERIFFRNLLGLMFFSPNRFQTQIIVLSGNLLLATFNVLVHAELDQLELICFHQLAMHFRDTYA